MKKKNKWGAWITSVCGDYTTLNCKPLSFPSCADRLYWDFLSFSQEGNIFRLTFTYWHTIGPHVQHTLPDVTPTRHLVPETFPGQSSKMTPRIEEHRSVPACGAASRPLNSLCYLLIDWKAEYTYTSKTILIHDWERNTWTMSVARTLHCKSILLLLQKQSLLLRLIGNIHWECPQVVDMVLLQINK